MKTAMMSLVFAFGLVLSPVSFAEDKATDTAPKAECSCKDHEKDCGCSAKQCKDGECKTHEKKMKKKKRKACKNCKEEKADSAEATEKK